MSHPDDEALVCTKKSALKTCPQCGSKPGPNCTFEDLRNVVALSNNEDEKMKTELMKGISKSCMNFIKKIVSYENDRGRQSTARGFQTSRGSNGIHEQLAGRFGVSGDATREMMHQYGHSISHRADLLDVVRALGLNPGNMNFPGMNLGSMANRAHDSARGAQEDIQNRMQTGSRDAQKAAQDAQGRAQDMAGSVMQRAQQQGRQATNIQRNVQQHASSFMQNTEQQSRGFFG